MLNVLSICLPECSQEGCLRAFKSIERQGFVPVESLQWQGGSLRAWAHPTQLAAENCVVRTSTGYACCVGPLWYRGRFGIAALRVLFDEAGEGRNPDETELRGNFALFIRNRGTCLLMNDALGLVRLYASPDKQFHSTSWLATCAYAGDVELDEHSAAEYVLLGASHSDRTVARNITILPLAHAFDLTQARVRPRIPPSGWIGPPAPQTFDDAVNEVDALLRRVFNEIAGAFAGRVRAALSGGFDSRLIVAGLLACGEQPELFVYGDPRSEDVPIARQVASGVGIPIDIIDKAAMNAQTAPPDIERCVESALFFDGLPNDGIDDPGADQRTRLQSTAGASLVPNGGGGEILRNFFHLPDRRFHAIDVVRAFYRGFDRGVFRHARGVSDYEDRIASWIEFTVGTGEHVRRRLSREQVELIYPLFRCHYWMAVNNSVAVRHGNYLTPLVDLNTVRLACRLPLAWKSAGRLESRLITQLHAAIANQPSSYGFRFADGPGRSAQLKEWTVCARPIFARPFINATRRRLHRQQVAPGVLARYRSLLPGEWRMDSILDLTRLPDNVAFARALAVEITWRELLG